MNRWAHLGVLLVFAAGFFTMHGFLAVSAQAETHHGKHRAATTLSTTAAHTEAQPGVHLGPRIAGAALGPSVHSEADVGAGSTDLGHAPDRPTPAEHHDLAAGCVVALVGVALAGLALLLLRRSRVVGDLQVQVSDLVQCIRVSVSRWSPPRVALCVIRV